jgi:hypothetical protein
MEDFKDYVLKELHRAVINQIEISKESALFPSWNKGYQAALEDMIFYIDEYKEEE